MELRLYKGLLVVLLLHLCQGQVPSPSPESALPSLGDVMDAVRAAFMEAVKISKDDAARAVFEQVVEELGPQENIAEKPLATADDTDDGLPAVEHNHADKETTTLSEENAKQEQADPKLNSSEQMLLLPDEKPDEKPVESIYQLNRSAEESIQEVKDSDLNLPQDLVEPTQEPKESFELELEDTSPRDGKQTELDPSQFLSFESTPEAEREEQAGLDEEKHKQVESELVKAHEQTQDTNRIAELEIEDGQEKDVETDIESEIQEGGLLELVKQREPRPDQDQKHFLVGDDLKERIIVEEEQSKDEQGLVDAGGHVVEVRTEEEDVDGEAAAHVGKESVETVGGAEVESLIPVLKVTEKTSQEQVEVVSETPKPQKTLMVSTRINDVMRETNELNDIVTSRHPVLDQDVPTVGTGMPAFPPFPTLGIELGENDELAEEPADAPQSPTSKQEAWKFGVIAIAFFLILQTLITVTYILKCRRNRSRCTGPEKVCENGIGAVKDDANAEADEQATLDDLPEHSEIQKEMLAMTPIHTQSMVENSSNH